jgi:transcriptional regulator GlxA family with amidase domain
MRTVTILAMEQAMAASVMGPMDIFRQAGFTWNYIFGQEPTPLFTTQIATLDGQPVQAFNGALIAPHCAAGEVDSTDIILVASFASYDPLQHAGQVGDWLRLHHSRGAVIGSVCLGSFLLAATGLLDGKTATTHWGFADAFREHFPNVKLLPDKLIADEGDLLTSGACNSYIDLSLYLIERFCGLETALECSKTILHDRGRSSQTPYSTRRFRKDHGDPEVLAVQEQLENSNGGHPDISGLAKEHGMSRRSFERRFKAATGDAPLTYLQRLRVEAAKRMLETAPRSFNEIAYELGYEDSSFFRKVFKKHTGLLPREYRQKFRSIRT